MPFNTVTGLFARARSFVSLFQSGDDITRADLDIECNDLAAGINAALTNSLNFVGEWSGLGAFPTARPDLTDIRPRDTWRVTTGGTVDGVTFAPDDYLVALLPDAGATYAGNWLRVPNLFLPAVLATLAGAQAEADAAAASALAASGSASAASGSASAAAGSASAAQASLTSTLAIANALPEWRGSWLTGTAYALGDLVQTGGSSYICIIAHTSGTFATDLAALRWAVFAAQGAPGAGTGDLLASQNLNDLANKGTARTNIETVHYIAAATAPGTPQARMLWRDTSLTPSVLKMRDDANAAWIIVDPVYAGLLGAVSIAVADLNVWATSGQWRSASGATGNPLAGEAFRFTHWAGADGTTATQIAQGATSARLFIRNRAAGAWGAWGEIFNIAQGGQLLAGVTAANDADGTFSSGTYTPTPTGGNIKSLSNAGAFTLAAPNAAGVYTLVLEVTNAAGAGAITFSGFAKVTGDLLTVTVGNKFQIFIAKTLNGVTASIVAMQ